MGSGNGARSLCLDRGSQTATTTDLLQLQAEDKSRTSHVRLLWVFRLGIRLDIECPSDYSHRNDKGFIRRTEKQGEKLLREPTLGKPIRYSLNNRLRVHVGSFFIVYEFYDGELRFLDLDHHDKIYKKWL